MATDKILRDLGELHARLFDHRPVLKGEINFFLHEFEEKRNNREQIRLEKTLEYNTEIAEKLIPASINSMNQNLTALLDKLKESNEKCDAILQKETQSEKLTWLNEERQKRKLEWARFMDGQCEKSASVDEEYEREVGLVKEYYKDLENKLQINSEAAAAAN